MEFKIDTKDNYTQITPHAAHLDASLTAAITDKCTDLAQNMIIDLRNCVEADTTAFPDLVTLHEEMYSADNSLVFTGIGTVVMEQLKEKDTDLLLNIAPTLVEAIDIISMEILERDLFKEE
ncbi:MAG: hypothetical protein H0X33_02660 [Taibaiella sp.]|nr:hypothetical protein [Taibaiella sp.]